MGVITVLGLPTSTIALTDMYYLCNAPPHPTHDICYKDVKNCAKEMRPALSAYRLCLVTFHQLEQSTTKGQRSETANLQIDNHKALGQTEEGNCTF